MQDRYQTRVLSDEALVVPRHGGSYLYLREE
jgi:hypothetical protein